jgi:hypothetical protein
MELCMPGDKSLLARRGVEREWGRQRSLRSAGCTSDQMMSMPVRRLLLVSITDKIADMNLEEELELLREMKEARALTRHEGSRRNLR